LVAGTYTDTNFILLCATQHSQKLTALVLVKYQNTEERFTRIPLISLIYNNLQLYLFHFWRMPIKGMLDLNDIHLVSSDRLN